MNVVSQCTAEMLALWQTTSRSECGVGVSQQSAGTMAQTKATRTVSTVDAIPNYPHASGKVANCISSHTKEAVF